MWKKLHPDQQIKYYKQLVWFPSDSHLDKQPRENLSKGTILPLCEEFPTNLGAL